MTASSPEPSRTESRPAFGLGAQANTRMAWGLRIGLAIAFAVLAFGLAAFVFAHPNEDRRTLVNSNPIGGYLQVPALVQGLVAGRTEAYLTLGILILVFTPVGRVAIGWYYFRRAGDRVLVWISTTVFALLLVGLFVIGPLIR
jgi:uncharacterized membrane protein